MPLARSAPERDDTPPTRRSVRRDGAERASGRRRWGSAVDAGRRVGADGGILSGMVLRLAGDLPILWRSPSSVQVGSEALAVVDDVTDGDTRLIAALASGVSESGFAMMARSAGVSEQRRDELLATFAPALAASATPGVERVAVLGDSALARSIAGLLAASGPLVAPEDAGLVVLVGDWVLAPADHTTWLNRDVPHVPVLAAERSVAVGPFVEPGDGPCLYCVQLARADDDDAWPALATQLLGRPAPELDVLARTEAAAFAARRVVERAAGRRFGGRSWRLDAAGVSERTWRQHPDCRCAAPAGIDWAAAPHRAAPAAPTTATGVDAPG